MDLHKERTSGKGISERTDLGAVAMAKPEPVSPVHGLIEGLRLCNQSSLAGLLLFAQHTGIPG